MIESDLPYLS